SAEISSTSSREYSSPPAVFCHTSSPAGGSPRRASTLSIPASRISSRVARSSSTVAPTQVKCAIASRPYSSRIRLTISIVFSLVEPPTISSMRILRLCSPALGIAGDALDPAGRGQVRQVAERLGHQPVRVLSRQRIAEDERDDLEGRALVADERSRDLLELLVHELAVALDVGVDVGERAPMPGEAQAGAESLHDIERAQELPHRIGRVAVVEVQRDASQ